MAYKYPSRLMGHELRLLCPVSVTPSRLDFKMIMVARSSAPTYTALSYAWGDQDATELIFLNGQPFPVRPNLWSCLFNLAGTTRNWNFWVDAICINQEDNQEKSTQVKRMSDTYARADHVAVWLGLPRIREIDRSRFADPAMLKTRRVEPFEWWDNMEDLARRLYWNRYWVIQEMLLGREILIWCGNHVTTGGHFLETLCSHGDIDQFSSTPPDWNNDRYPALTLMMGRHIDRYPEFREPLGTLLVRHCRSECKDTRDRVFALIGIVDQDEAALLSRFFPDYSLSEREVVVIALAHLTQAVTSAASLEFRDIDVHSEEIFEAFRIPDRKQRRELLDLAERLDYIGSESVEEIRSQLLHCDRIHLPGPSNPSTVDVEAMTLAYEALLPHLFPQRQRSNCQIL